MQISFPNSTLFYTLQKMAIKTAEAGRISKPKLVATTEEPNIAAKLLELRRAAGVSQDALGAQGFISTPGWIKIENGQRMPSEKLLAALVAFLVGEKVIRANQKDALIHELCTLKYAGHRSPFLQQIAKDQLKTLTPVTIQPR